MRSLQRTFFEVTACMVFPTPLPFEENAAWAEEKSVSLRNPTSLTVEE